MQTADFTPGDIVTDKNGCSYILLSVTDFGFVFALNMDEMTQPIGRYGWQVTGGDLVDGVLIDKCRAGYCTLENYTRALNGLDAFDTPEARKILEDAEKRNAVIAAVWAVTDNDSLSYDEKIAGYRAAFSLWYNPEQVAAASEFDIAMQVYGMAVQYAQNRQL